MNKKILKLFVKTSYTSKMFYPKCEVSNLFAELLNEKTLSKQTLRLLEKHGYDFEFEFENQNEKTRFI